MGRWTWNWFLSNAASRQTRNEPPLTEEQKLLYAQERLENFRWISRLVATKSPYVLTTDELLPQTIAEELSDVGQFVELCYSPVALNFLLAQRETLLGKGFPLEGYAVLRDISPEVWTLRSTVAQVPAWFFHRTERQQLVVAFAGTSSLQMALQDLRVFMQQHSSRQGRVHSGFWAIYRGMKSQLLSALRQALLERNWEIVELVCAGHSMGSCIAYLLCMDLLTLNHGDPLFGPLKRMRIKVVAFGAPRTGDMNLVNHYRSVVRRFKEENGQDSFVEYSIKAYNDGVPSLPPMYLGYRHFATRPIYLDKGILFTIPESENEHALFSVSAQSTTPSQYPLGGHNYYSNRDLEQLIRRFAWLVEAQYMNPGWEGRYKALASKRFAQS